MRAIKQDDKLRIRLSEKPSQCTKLLHSGSGNTLQQVEAFKYFAMAFTNDGKQIKAFNRRGDKANAVFDEVHRSLLTKFAFKKH